MDLGQAAIVKSEKHEGLIFFYAGGPHHIETNPLICRENQWTGFYMVRDLRHERVKSHITTLKMKIDKLITT